LDQSAWNSQLRLWAVELGPFIKDVRTDGGGGIVKCGQGDGGGR